VFSSEESKRREFGMKNNNQINVPQAREAMDKFKMQAASEVGVNLTNGYNGHLTSREAGSVGGQMVKKDVSRTNYKIRQTQPDFCWACADCAIHSCN
jgi:small acid-soluble spore protein D (minor alpha/beta-type SASP)